MRPVPATGPGEKEEGMADEKLGGLLGMMQRSGADRGGGIMGLPYPTGGLLAMYEKKQRPVYSVVNGSDAVDEMLSSGDPSRRFKVYRRNLGSDKNGGTRGSSSSFAHWLFISEDGKHGFGFNQDGEELELPESLEGYDEHPEFIGKTFTAAGLNNARQIRRERFANMKAYIDEHPELFLEPDKIIDFEEYHPGGNNCQQYIRDLSRNYLE